jgi:flagellar biosynthesis/type III secretory pathway chaperone
MNELLTILVDSLREELKQYGEMLALLDLQQEQVVMRLPGELIQTVAAINAQGEVILAARREREQRQRDMARTLRLPEDSPLAAVIPLLPPDYQPLIQALVQENNHLLVRVQQRARQNHLLLSRSVEMMQQFINSFCPAGTPVYSGSGSVIASAGAPRAIYDAVG